MQGAFPFLASAGSAFPLCSTISPPLEEILYLTEKLADAVDVRGIIRPELLLLLLQEAVPGQGSQTAGHVAGVAAVFLRQLLAIAAALGQAHQQHQLGLVAQGAKCGANLIQILPYVLVLIGGIIGINVFVVLLIGIVSGAVIALATGATGQTGILAVKALLENMGSGAAGMFETSMVAILVSAICALIREYGGFEALLSWIRKAFRGKRGGQIGMGLLVGAMDIATANNTVAIVMANPIAKEMSEEYGITPRKAASLLDTFSCIFQGIIPYGAQMLVAISTCATLGYAISAFDIIPLLFYPFLLCLSSLLFILFDKK